MQNLSQPGVRALSRREALTRIAGGFGAVGLAGVLQGAAAHPFDPKPTHFPPRAKHIIYLMLNGGLSQVDSFDPKPALDRYDGKPVPGGVPQTESSIGSLMRSPFSFSK